MGKDGEQTTRQSVDVGAARAEGQQGDAVRPASMRRQEAPFLFWLTVIFCGTIGLVWLLDFAIYALPWQALPWPVFPDGLEVKPEKVVQVFGLGLTVVTGVIWAAHHLRATQLTPAEERRIWVGLVSGVLTTTVAVYAHGLNPDLGVRLHAPTIQWATKDGGWGEKRHADNPGLCRLRAVVGVTRPLRVNTLSFVAYVETHDGVRRVAASRCDDDRRRSEPVRDLELDVCTQAVPISIDDAVIRLVAAEPGSGAGAAVAAAVSAGAGTSPG